MKILHVTKKYPQALGGDAVVVANLQEQQQTANHTTVIVTSNCNEIKEGRDIYKFGLKDTPAQLDAITLRRIVSLCMLFFQMFALLGKERPDIIHTHSIDMAFIVSWAARWYRIPIIHTFHIVTFYDKNQSALRRKTELWLARGAKPYRITAPNNYDVRKLRAAGLTQAVALPNGVDLATWAPRGYIEKNQQATFIAVGRLEDQKGYTYLIRAAALLAATKSLQVIIVGDGSQKAKLQGLIQSLHIEHSVLLVGQKSPKEIRTLLSEAHVAVFPSLYETTPLTLLEAWAAKIPTIATPVGILRHTPSDFKATLLTPREDAHALAAMMQRCINDEQLCAATAAAGYEEAKKYAWPTIAQTLETIYRGAA
jgi:glycosyltransferase involved in cell wall biosynthesis